ncbi:hypothetical protein K1719_039805 [Acacia pycnantha]|nr:hypothetical protein K1719_039805 [Acacia pycnantha]
MGKEGGRSLKRGEPETPSSGCISSFFHLFDFHPFHFSLQHHHPQPSFNDDHTTTTTIPKGTEAPRNSLESVDSTMVVGSISKPENLEVPKNKLFIKTSTTGKVGNVVNDLAPGTKTPTLVARLMGLDLLPETVQSPSSSSPSSSSTTTTTSSSCLSATKSQQVNPRHHNHNHHHHYLSPRQNNNVVITKARHSMDDSIAASHFLPETPRISSARRSDVEHRLSLQINKENMQDFLELPRFSFSKLKFEEQQGHSKSPRHYAKQIVKQMRECVLSSKKVGSDVTNTVKNNNNREKKQEGGEFVVVGQFKRSKKSPGTKPTCSSSSSDELINSPAKVLNNNPPSCSPRLRFMDPKKDQNSPQAKPKPQEAIILVQQQEQVLQIQKQKKSASSVPMSNRKAANEKFSARLKKQDKFVLNKKQGESFVRPLLSSSNIKSSTGNKSKRSSHPLLINLLNLNTVQNINSNTPPPAIKIPQKQVCVAREEVKYCSSQLSSGSSQTYTKEATTSSSSSCVLSTTTTGESNVAELDKRKISGGSMFNHNGPEFQYVSSILSRTGFAVKKGTSTTNATTVMAVSLFHQWLSPTQQALDPSIFHHLEQWYHSQSKNDNQNPTCDIFSVFSQDRDLRPNDRYDMGVRCNRRLLFDLVNETLLKLEVNVGTCYNEEAVWERINGTFDKSNKKCEVLEHIDELIDMEDMGKKMMKKKSEEAMVAEIEGNIIDTLLHETVMVVTECCC